MGNDTAVRRLRGTLLGQYLLGGIGGGLVGGIAMGLILHLAGENIIRLIGGMYGNSSILAGWTAHLFNSALFGIVFVATVRRHFIRDFATTVGGCIGLGIVYGALLEVVSGGIILPLAVSLTPIQEIPFPVLTESPAGLVTIAIAVGIAHLVYGAVLGFVYASVREGPRGSL